MSNMQVNQLEKRMIKYLFLTIPGTFRSDIKAESTYDSLQNPIKFQQDTFGVSTWVMKHPLTIYSSDLTEKHVFKQNEIKIQPTTNANLEEKWKYFVVSKGDGGKYYCTSQIFYELGMLRRNLSTSQILSARNKALGFHEYTNSQQQFYLPKCLVIISEHPYFKLEVNLLKIHKELRKKQPAISYCVEEELYNVYLQYLETGREKEWENLNLANIPNQKRSYCPLEISFGYYVECCNSHSLGQSLYIEKSSNRQVLHLYKLQESSLYQISYFFHLPFSPKTTRIILSAMLTEKQIIFCSSNQNLIVMVMQTLIQMIMPLKWCYMYVPNLPIELLEAAQESFQPFMVGINKNHMSLINPKNKVIVKVDSDEIMYNEEELFTMSSKFDRFLTFKANSNKQYLEWEKQVRINSILLITYLFKDNVDSHQQFLSEKERLSEKDFYDEFLNKSMMYQKLIEDVHENVYSEFYKLIKLTSSERKVLISNKFNALHSQTIYPAKHDNKKKWIKYFEKFTRQKRKSRFIRHSLSMIDHHHSNSLSHSFLPQQESFRLQNQQFNNLSSSYISQSPLNQSMLVSGRNSNNNRSGQTYNKIMKKFENKATTQGPNELYQSNIISHYQHSQSNPNLLNKNQQIVTANTNTVTAHPIKISESTVSLTNNVCLSSREIAVKNSQHSGYSDMRKNFHQQQVNQSYNRGEIQTDGADSSSKNKYTEQNILRNRKSSDFNPNPTHHSTIALNRDERQTPSKIPIEPHSKPHLDNLLGGLSASSSSHAIIEPQSIRSSFGNPQNISTSSSYQSSFSGYPNYSTQKFARPQNQFFTKQPPFTPQNQMQNGKSYSTNNTASIRNLNTTHSTVML